MSSSRSVSPNSNDPDDDEPGNDNGDGSGDESGDDLDEPGLRPEYDGSSEGGKRGLRPSSANYHKIMSLRSMNCEHRLRSFVR